MRQLYYDLIAEVYFALNIKRRSGCWKRVLGMNINVLRGTVMIGDRAMLKPAEAFPDHSSVSSRLHVMCRMTLCFRTVPCPRPRNVFPN